MDPPSTNGESGKETGPPALNVDQDPDQDPLQTAIPLLSDVVIPGAALAEAVKTVTADARCMPTDDTQHCEQQLMERLLPKIGELIELSVREALFEASRQVVHKVLSQLHHQILTMPQEQTATATQQSPAEF